MRGGGKWLHKLRLGAADLGEGSQAPAELLLEGGGGRRTGLKRLCWRNGFLQAPQHPKPFPKEAPSAPACPSPGTAAQPRQSPSQAFPRRGGGTAWKLHSQDSVPLQCVTRETRLPGTSSPPQPGAHTPGHPSAARSPHALCSQEALGQELRTGYLQGSRVLEASAELPALRSLACRFRGSWTPTVQLTRSSSPANSWG